jgi:pSer/pThr/pTyr-binding forkhead associated (FHA) protein
VRSRFVLGPGAYEIGRAPECALCVEAELVSRRHARLTIGSDGLVIEDLGSSNGTRLDGRRRDAIPPRPAPRNRRGHA